MKESIIYIVLYIILCIGCRNGKLGNNHSATNIDSVWLSKIEEVQLQMDEMQKHIGRLDDNIETLVQDIYFDSLSYKEIKLKQGYSIFFTPQREYVDGRLSIYCNYMLKGNGIMKMLEGWYRTNELVDFKNHFILFGVQGKPVEFFLYEKKTGILRLHASSLKVNIEKEAFIYHDYPEGDDNFYIFDLKTQNKIQLKLPDSDKYPWTKYGNAYESVFIKDKRNGCFILGSTENENSEWILN